MTPDTLRSLCERLAAATRNADGTPGRFKMHERPDSYIWGCEDSDRPHLLATGRDTEDEKWGWWGPLADEVGVSMTSMVIQAQHMAGSATWTLLEALALAVVLEFERRAVKS